MGRDKALIEFRGQPLIQHAVSLLSSAGLSTAIAGGQPALGAFAPLLPDRTPDQGPLGGVCSALASLQSQYALFVSVDQPLLPPALLGALLSRAQSASHPVVLVSLAGFAQTFPVVLDRALLPFLQAELSAGHSGCFSAFQAAADANGRTIEIIEAEYFAQNGRIVHPDGLSLENWFLNINTINDLRLAAAIDPPASRKLRSHRVS